MTTLSSPPERVPLPARESLRATLGVFAAGFLVALAVSLAVFIIALNPPGEDIRLLVLFLTVSGMLSILAAYGIYRAGLVHWFRSLRWTLLVVVTLTVLLVFVNVWGTAQLMFLSLHDFWLTTALLIFAGLLALAFGQYASSTITERIHLLARTAERVARGDLSARVAVRGNDELAELAQTFNWMAETLQQNAAEKQRLEQARRDLIAWVSHDLRTPLASMQAMVEAVLDGVVADPDTVTRYLQTTRGEIQHLSHLIDDLFALSQLDVGQIAIAFEWASLRDLLSDTLSSMQPAAAAAQVTLSGTVPPDVDPVYLAPDKIQRVLYNLLDNAIRHTPPGGQITLAARRQADEVQITVTNTGSVIAPEDLPHVFERFYRGRDSGSPAGDRRRAGLGLAIAREFVAAHRGRVWAASSPDAGTTFGFSLPVTGPEDAPPPRSPNI
ncbi:MAG: hypothetical protein Kow0077_32310 [Anaerolineae bacterium]